MILYSCWEPPLASVFQRKAAWPSSLIAQTSGGLLLPFCDPDFLEVDVTAGIVRTRIDKHQEINTLRNMCRSLPHRSFQSLSLHEDVNNNSAMKLM